LSPGVNFINILAQSKYAPAHRVWCNRSHSVSPTNSGTKLRQLVSQLYDISALNFCTLRSTLYAKKGKIPLAENLLVKFAKVGRKC